jgi:hypothetical protein
MGAGGAGSGAAIGSEEGSCQTETAIADDQEY